MEHLKELKVGRSARESARSICFAPHPHPLRKTDRKGWGVKLDFLISEGVTGAPVIGAPTVADPEGGLGGLTPPPSEVLFFCLSVYENSGPEPPFKEFLDPPLPYKVYKGPRSEGDYLSYVLIDGTSGHMARRWGYFPSFN